MDRDREQQILAEYEAMLQTAENRLEAVTRDVEELRPLVLTLQKRLSRSNGHAPASRARTATDSVPVQDHATAQVARATYRGRPTIPSVVMDILSDGARHTLDDLHAALQAHEAFEDGKPSRASLVNRLGDLAARGDIVKVARGVYELAPKAGTENDDPDADSTPAIQTGGQKTLDERQEFVDTARPRADPS